MKHNKKAGKRKLKLVIAGLTVAALVLSLVITNIFIPVKYIGAYIVFKKDECPPETMRVRYLNAGFGDGALVEFPDGKTMLIDGGAGTYANVHMLLKTLNSGGIDKIDYLVCTSVKSEHCGSLAEIVKYKPVGVAYIPDVKNGNITDEYAAFLGALSSKGVRTETAEFGKGVYCPEFRYNFYFLSPSAKETGRSEYDDMNALPSAENIDAASVVLWIDCFSRGFLFLGDATYGVQTKIAGTIAAEGGKYFFDGMEFAFSDCAAVKAANHCAGDSVCGDLYGLIKPSAAIISVGQNAKNCPSQTDIAKLQSFCGDGVFRTDVNGAITVTVTLKNLKIEKEF